MLTRLSLLTLAMTGIASVAYAQSMASPAEPAQPQMSQAMPSGSGRHSVAITDEYGFHYDSMGNRLNAAGHVIAPPHTPSGARIIQNGTGAL